MYTKNINNGSSGRIRTYDQSVNPVSVRTLPMSYLSNPSSRVCFRRVDFHDLISRSRRIALERSGCSSDQPKVHGPFLRVNFPAILLVRSEERRVGKGLTLWWT